MSGGITERRAWRRRKRDEVAGTCRRTGGELEGKNRRRRVHGRPSETDDVLQPAEVVQEEGNNSLYIGRDEGIQSATLSWHFGCPVNTRVTFRFLSLRLWGHVEDN